MNKSKKSKDNVSGNDTYQIRQNSNYKHGSSAPDNNIFFEVKSNPLSSKGN